MATVSKEFDNLDFAIEKSLRYHQRRQGHFERLHMIVMIAAIISGSAAFINFVGQPKLFGMLAAVFAATDLVLAFSHRARDHAVLHRRFTDLAIELRVSDRDDVDDLRKWQTRRLEIETEEPPTYWALDASCDNEVSIAWGWHRENGVVPLTLLQRIFMNWLRFEKTEFPDRVYRDNREHESNAKNLIGKDDQNREKVAT